MSSRRRSSPTNTSPTGRWRRRSFSRQARETLAARRRGRRGKDRSGQGLQRMLGAKLIRLQCYEGLDISTAVYEWNYPRQMLYLRAAEIEGESKTEALHDIFGPDFLLRRPLLQAIEALMHSHRCCSSTSSIAPTMSSRPICWKCSRISRSPSLRSERCSTAPANCRPDLESHPRGPRCPQAPLPLSLDRIS